MFLQINFIVITLGHGCSAVNFLHIFRTLFYKNTYKRLLLFFLFHQTDYIILRGKPYSACAKNKAFHEDFLWETADLFAFNKDIFNEKIHLLCSSSFTVS